jgi:hypothetical protein
VLGRGFEHVQARIDGGRRPGGPAHLIRYLGRVFQAPALEVGGQRDGVPGGLVVGLAALDRAQPQRDRRGQAYFGLPTKVNLVEDVAAELLLERLRVRFSLAWSQAAKNSDSALLKLDDPTTRRGSGATRLKIAQAGAP